MLIKIALELGEAVNSQHRQMSKIKKPCTVEALTLLHARSCQVASEILVLLRSGFADGAIARWRTLHELVVVACFIRERGEIVAEPYFQHRAIEAYKAAKQYQQYCKLLHYEPLSELEIEHHKKLYDSAVEKFGAPFREQYGWAAAALKNPRPNFANIEQHVRLDHLRPFYKMASENVHAEPTGVIRRLGFIGQGAALAGPSNVGLADPGESTALSLMQITSCLLLLLTPTIDTVSMCKMMLKLTNEIGESFFSAQEKISEKAMRLGQT